MKKFWSSFRDPLDYKLDWQSMSLSAKIGFIWDYYKIPIFILLAVLYAIGYLGYRYATRTYPVLYVDAVNVMAGEDLSAVLTDQYTDDPAYSKRDRIYFQNAMFLSDDPASPYFQESHASQIKILASINSQQLDVVLMDKDAFDSFSQNGFLMDLEELSQRTDLADAGFLSEISEDFTKNLIVLSDNQMEATLDPNVEYKAETKEALLGLDLSGTALFGPDKFPDTVYLGIATNTSRLEEALKYVRYIYETQ